MKPALRFALAVMMLACASGSQAEIIQTEISPPHTVAVRDLIGLTPAQTQRRLTGLEIDWPRITGLEMLSGHDLLSFAAVDDYLNDPAAVELSAKSRTRGDENPRNWPKSWSGCVVEATPGGNGSILLMFRNDRLEGVWSGPSVATKTSLAPDADTLPLADSQVFLAHWGRTLVDPDTRLTTRCNRHEIASARPPSRPRRLSASDTQGLALAPFTVGLPVMNGARGAHRRAGPALYAQLAPGYRLPGGLHGFLSQHGGVRAIHGRDPDYVILKVDLGGYPSRNLSNTEDFGLVGVRGGVVAWRALDYSQAAPQLPPPARR